MQMSQTEKRLFKEQVIREYQLKQEGIKKNNNLIRKIKERLSLIIPFNILVGIIASGVFIFYFGVKAFGQLVLTGIIWLTIISTVVAALLKK